MNTLYDTITLLQKLRNDFDNNKIIAEVDIKGSSGVKRVPMYIDPNGGGTISGSTLEEELIIKVTSWKK